MWALRGLVGVALGSALGALLGVALYGASAPSFHRRGAWAALQDRRATCSLDELGPLGPDSQGQPMACIPVLAVDVGAGTPLGAEHLRPVVMPAAFLPNEVLQGGVGRELTEDGYRGDMLRRERVQ